MMNRVWSEFRVIEQESYIESKHEILKSSAVVNMGGGTHCIHK